MASQTNDLRHPRAEADGTPFGPWPISRRFVEKTPGSEDFVSSTRIRRNSEGMQRATVGCEPLISRRLQHNDDSQRFWVSDDGKPPIEITPRETVPVRSHPLGIVPRS